MDSKVIPLQLLQLVKFPDFGILMMIKDKNNNTLTTEREQYLRWKEHFQEVLNRKDPDELAIISEAPMDL
jgi:hypothetical protein